MQQPKEDRTTDDPCQESLQGEDMRPREDRNRTKEDEPTDDRHQEALQSEASAHDGALIARELEPFMPGEARHPPPAIVIVMARDPHRMIAFLRDSGEARWYELAIPVSEYRNRRASGAEAIVLPSWLKCGGDSDRDVELEEAAEASEDMPSFIDALSELPRWSARDAMAEISHAHVIEQIVDRLPHWALLSPCCDPIPDARGLLRATAAILRSARSKENGSLDLSRDCWAMSEVMRHIRGSDGFSLSDALPLGDAPAGSPAIEPSARLDYARMRFSRGFHGGDAFAPPLEPLFSTHEPGEDGRWLMGYSFALNAAASSPFFSDLWQIRRPPGRRPGPRAPDEGADAYDRALVANWMACPLQGWTEASACKRLITVHGSGGTRTWTCLAGSPPV